MAGGIVNKVVQAVNKVKNIVTSPPKTKPKPRLSWRNGYHPDLLIGLWDGVVHAADSAEKAILRTVVKHIKLPKPKKPAFVQEMRKIVPYWVGRINGAMQRAIARAWRLGNKSGYQLARQLEANAPKSPRNPNKGVTVRVPKSMFPDIQGVADQLYGTGSEIFDTVVKHMIATPATSEASRLRAAQKILNEYATQGITGFVDKGGRNWNLTSYVEMATRTAAGNAALYAHLGAVSAAGFDVVRVTVMPNCAPQCIPFQGRLLSISGATKKYAGEKVVCSVAEAIERGFRHPNCRHTARIWVKGDKAPDPDMLDPGDYEATQKQRYMERKIREWKRRYECALTPEEENYCRGKVREWQAKLREHIRVTGLPRKREREQLHTVR